MRQNIPVIIIIIIIVVAGVWWYSSYNQGAVQVSPAAPDETSGLVERIKRISIDTSIFSDQAFMNLVASQSFSVDGLILGHPNPFQPARRSVAPPAPSVKR